MKRVNSKNKIHKEVNMFMNLNNKEREILFKETPTNSKGFLLLNIPKRMRLQFLKEMKDREIVNIIHYLDLDDTTDLIQDISNYRRRNIINKLSKDTKEKIEFLLKFDPRTAAGMMSLDYIEVHPHETFEKVAKSINKHEKRTGRFPTILVVEDGYLIGELHGHELGLKNRKAKVEKHINRVPTISYNADQNEIFKVFKSHPHNKIVVLDDDMSIIGVIYSDDMLNILQKRPSKSLYDFAGVKDEEDVLDPALIKVKHRYKWLIINLMTAFIAASVVGLFQDTISKFVLLAVYMPIIAGMGGNAGTQTLAVMVRGISLKEIELKTGFKVIMREMFSGGVNGIINGIIVALVAIFFHMNAILGVILGISMIINLAIAGFFGATIPLIMKKLGKDPATSATVFITTFTDLFGFFIFLGLASMFL